jgi:predicted permease
MSLWTDIGRRAAFFIRQAQFDRELDAEIRTHLEMRADDLEQRGLSRDEALAQARREFGSGARVSEEVRAAWQFRWLEELTGDVRYALRAFRRSPVFTFTAVVSLALGIGANSAIVAALDAVLWRPLPVADPQSLVTLSVIHANGSIRDNLPAEYIARLRVTDVFSDIVTQTSDGLSFTYDERAERIVAEAVSPNYFSFLGLRPILGQAFTPAVEAGGGWAPEAVLSYRFWQRRFAGDRGVIGRVIHLNTYPFTIVGVSPPGFLGLVQGFDPELRIPHLPDGQELNEIRLITGARSRSMTAMARLSPRVTLAHAEGVAEAQLQQFLRTATGPEARRIDSSRARVLPGAQGWADGLAQFHAPLFVLLALVGVVLLTACANVASMLLARATTRRRELAVRASIGAGRARLVRQLLTESLLLSLLGGALGFAVAGRATELLVRFLPQGHISLFLDLRPDARMLTVAFALSLVTGLLFGIVPALQVTRGDLAATLKADAGTSVGEPRGARLRKLLVASQVAFSLVLLVVAGLFVRTLANLRPADLHTRTDRVLLFTLKPQLEIYTPERKRLLTSELVRRVSALPGVQSAALAEGGPLASRQMFDSVRVPGQAEIRAASDDVTPGFFDAIGARLIAGRDFGASDKPGVPRVAIINATLARMLFKGDDPIGHIIELRPIRNEPRRHQVIGVAADFHYHDLHAAAEPTVWFTFQDYPPYMPTLHVRASGADTGAVVAAVRREFDAIDKGFPVFNIKTLDLRIEDALARERLVADLSAAFGILALLLAAIGLYGVLAYSVSRRTREIGLRMALGSTTRSVLWLITREALQLVASGSVAGFVIAVVAARLLAPYLFGVSTFDPAAFLASAVAMLLVAAIAVSIPAYRATRVDPLAALRHD